MAITPSTNLFLLKVPLEIDNKNQLTFADKNSQFNFFSSLESLEIHNISYQRKDGIIRYPAHIDTIIEYNYCMYQNENYNDKWFYAFITGMKYINDDMTEISISTDTWQTWQFDLEFKESFIEREMLNVNDDVPGANLQPEGLETGEFKIGGTAEFDELEPINVVAYSGDTLTMSNGDTRILGQGGFVLNGIAQSVVYLYCTNEHYGNLQKALSLNNQSDYIVTAFTIPKLAISDFMIDKYKFSNNYPNIFIMQEFNDLLGKTSQDPTYKTLVSTPTSLDGYSPRNQKLRTYPYLYLGYNPPNGSSKIYRYEDFENGTPYFKIISEINPNPTIHFIPRNYRGQTGDNLSDASSLNGYPLLSTRVDTFNVWLAQNSNVVSLSMQQEQYNYEIGMVKTGIEGVSNIIGASFTGNIAGALSSGANLGLDLASQSKNHEFYIKQQMAQIEKQEMLPDKVSMGGSNATLIGYGLSDKNIFTRYSIKNQFARKIDKYFDMFGYATNEVKIPNIHNRPNWNYIKTTSINIHAYIPQEDLQQIKALFDNGLTLWHNQNTFLDYSQNNR